MVCLSEVSLLGEKRGRGVWFSESSAGHADPVSVRDFGAKHRPDGGRGSGTSFVSFDG